MEKGESLYQRRCIFFQDILVIELNHYVFEFGHLIAINILNAQLILKAVEGSWE